MQHISQLLIQTGLGQGAYVPPSRANAIEPIDNGTFIRPLKQSFMKNRRIMDSTARLVSLLAGWGGQGRPIETTQGALADHMSKSVRQIQRMLHDAVREGYLRYAYTKNRIGMITGIKIYLNFRKLFGGITQYKEKNRRISATTKTSTINENLYLDSKKERDKDIDRALKQLASRADLEFR